MKKVLSFAAVALMLLAFTGCRPNGAPAALTIQKWTYSNTFVTASIDINSIDLKSGTTGIVSYESLGTNYSTPVKFTYNPFEGEGEFYPTSGTTGLYGEFEFKNNSLMEVDLHYKAAGGIDMSLLNDVWFSKSAN